MSILKDTEKTMAQTVEHFKEELKNIRTGRANTAMFDNISVEVYGTKMRLKDLATISSPEPRQILITPFDRNNAGFINQAIEKANLGLQAQIEGNVIRIIIPSLTEEARKKMVQRCHEEREKCKVSVRNHRREANDTLKKQKGEMSEDEIKKLEKDVQNITDKFCEQADKITTEKEQEVMTV